MIYNHHRPAATLILVFPWPIFIYFFLWVTHICLLVSASPRNYVQAPYNPLFPFSPFPVAVIPQSRTSTGDETPGTDRPNTPFVNPTKK